MALCDATGANCKNIAGETDKTYTIQSSDRQYRACQGDRGEPRRLGHGPERPDGEDRRRDHDNYNHHHARTVQERLPLPDQRRCARHGPLGSASLLISEFKRNPSTILGSTNTFTLRVRIGSTCGPFVSGAIVYSPQCPTTDSPSRREAKTDSNGYVTLTFDRLSGYPATSKQTSLVLFIRARKDGEEILAGISNRRLVSVPVHLNG